MGGSAVSDDVLYDPAYAMPRQRTAERSALQNLCAALRNRNVGDARVELDRLSERFRHLNFELSAKEFSSLVKCASAVMSTRNVIPILEHALFSGDGETLSVSATCIEQTITSSVPCSAKGEFTASVSRLSAIAATLDKAQPVKIAFNGDGVSINPGTVTVAQGRSTHRLPSLRVDDYPRALMQPLENVTAQWEAPAPVLARSLKDLCTFTGDEKRKSILRASSSIRRQAFSFPPTRTCWARMQPSGADRSAPGSRFRTKP
jgi:hypothetical protein